MAWNILVVVTLVILLGTIVIDIALTTDDIDGNTFSELLREYGMKTPFFPWVFACLAGRWFHPSDDLRPLWVSQAATYLTIVAATVVVVGTGIACKLVRGRDHWIPPWIIVVPGLVFGALVAPIATVAG